MRVTKIGQNNYKQSQTKSNDKQPSFGMKIVLPEQVVINYYENLSTFAKPVKLFMDKTRTQFFNRELTDFRKFIEDIIKHNSKRENHLIHSEIKVIKEIDLHDMKKVTTENIDAKKSFSVFGGNDDFQETYGDMDSTMERFHKVIRFESGEAVEMRTRSENSCMPAKAIQDRLINIKEANRTAEKSNLIDLARKTVDQIAD